MKIENRRLFTYPVLSSDGRDDYKTCKFFAEAKPHTNADAAGNLIFDVNLSTDCAEISRLIANGDAEYLFHVECPTTIYREIFTHAVGEFVCKIPLRDVKDKLYSAIFIVLCRDVKNFSCADWNDDFDGLTFDLQKGSILAYKNFPTLTLVEEPNLFKNVGSIFSIYRRIGDAPFVFDLTTQKIRIGLNSIGLLALPTLLRKSDTATDFERDDNFARAGLRVRRTQAGRARAPIGRVVFGVDGGLQTAEFRFY